MNKIMKTVEKITDIGEIILGITFCVVIAAVMTYS